MTDTPLSERFVDAQQRVHSLSERPDNLQLLRLYALYKQASIGDAPDTRPPMLDFAARMKHDGWAALRGTSPADAMQAYVALVDTLIAENG